MFDCVIPTRNARNGRAYTFEGIKIIKQAQYAEDAGPLEPGCSCAACTQYSRAYLRHLYMANEILSARLLTGHNLTFFWRLMERIRAAIRGGTMKQLRAELAAVFAGEREEMEGRFGETLT
jgi:queuine tRNA-ribosyltransferase